MGIFSYSRLFLIFLLAQIILIFYLRYEVIRTETLQTEYVSERIEDEFKATLGFYGDVASNGFDLFINSETNQKLLLKANLDSTTNEEKAQLRNQLYNKVLPLFNKLKKDYFQMMHFHLPDGTSFLRMHEAHTFGDPLFIDRPELQVASKRKKNLDVFAIGKDKHAFRYIFPLFSGKQFLGTFETGSTFKQVRHGISKSFDGEFLLVVKEAALKKALVPESFSHYEALDFNNEYWYQINDLPSEEHRQHAGHINDVTFKALLDKNKDLVNTNLKRNHRFSFLTNLNEDNYIVSFIPVYNVFDMLDGFVIVMVNNPVIAEVIENYILLYTLITILMIGAFVIFGYYTRRLLYSLDFQKTLLGSIPVPVFIKDKKNRYISTNLAYLESVGVNEDELIGKKADEIFEKDTVIEMNAQDQKTYENKGAIFNHETNVTLKGKSETKYFTVHKTVFDNIHGKTAGLIGVALDITQLKRHEKKQEALIADLKKALDEVKALQGIIPICSYCRKIRDDAGYWQQIEEYLSTHSSAEMSHGICNECLENKFPEFAEQRE